LKRTSTGYLGIASNTQQAGRGRRHPKGKSEDATTAQAEAGHGAVQADNGSAINTRRWTALVSGNWEGRAEQSSRQCRTAARARNAHTVDSQAAVCPSASSRCSSSSSPYVDAATAGQGTGSSMNQPRLRARRVDGRAGGGGGGGGVGCGRGV
jgi:hypothetical protein